VVMFLYTALPSHLVHFNVPVASLDGGYRNAFQKREARN